ncbi:MAG TPA: hypothetical protein VGN26_03600, partial [Armatimonadota bacterium]
MKDRPASLRITKGSPPTAAAPPLPDRLRPWATALALCQCLWLLCGSSAEAGTNWVLTWKSAQPMQGGVGTKVTIVIGISPAIPDRDLLGTMVAFTSPQGGMALSKATYTPNGEPASEMTFVTSVPATAANGPLTVGITPS